MRDDNDDDGGGGRCDDDDDNGGSVIRGRINSTRVGILILAGC